MENPRVFISGLGFVGRALLTLLPEPSSPACSLVGLSDSSGALLCPPGFSPGDLKAIGGAKANGLRLSAIAESMEGRPWLFLASTEEALDALKPDIFVELSPTDLRGGGAAGLYAKAALRTGADLVFASKGVLASDWEGITDLAEGLGRRMRFSATVGGGMPVLDAGLSFSQANPVDEIEAVLNGTCVYILSLMEEGLGFDEALRDAQAAGMAEADPSADLDGWDAAAKLCILARAVMGCALEVGAVERQSLREADARALRSAAEAGRAVRAVGRIVRLPAADGSASAAASIRLVELPAASPLARHGSENAVVFRSRFAGDLALIGKGAGPRETAAAVLRDIAILASSPAIG